MYLKLEISVIKVELIKTLINNLKERFTTDEIYFQNLNILLNLKKK